MYLLLLYEQRTIDEKHIMRKVLVHLPLLLLAVLLDCRRLYSPFT